MRFRLFALFACLASAFAQPAGFNYDEAKVPNYKLPELLVTESGKQVKTPRDWETKRRPEILRLFETQVFGKTPIGRPADLYWELLEADAPAFNGAAVRKQVRVYFRKAPGAPFVDVLLYVPRDVRGKPPVFVGLNFMGNHSTVDDPKVKLTATWLPDRVPGVKANRATEDSRNVQRDRWPIEAILKRGYAVATAYYGDIDPDFDDGFANGVHPLAYREGQTRPAADEWGSLGAWAWGMNRILDYLEKEPLVDAKRAILHGHSRLGKAALWAGAQDQRWAIVISNDSGEGGAAITRRQFGETIERINTAFPHWFATNYKKYNGRENDVPVDAHALLALVAPRPLYVSSAQEDQWADPKGEFLAAYHASPVWKLYGRKGIPNDSMPSIHHPVGDLVGYHIRAGKHDVTLYDWERWMDFADRHFGLK
jgi:hypothetical protein